MKFTNKTYIHAFLLGISALVAQVVLMRGLYSVFYGNELCMGVMLAIWLLWVAVGGYLGTRLLHFTLFTRFGLFAVWQVIYLVAVLIAVSSIWFVRSLTGVSFGEYITFGGLVLYTLGLLALPCILTGLQFTYLTSLVRDEQGPGIYVFEAAGSAFGGVIATLLLFPRYNDQAVLLVMTLFILFILFWMERKSWIMVLVVLLAALVLSPLPDKLQGNLMEIYWQQFGAGMELVEWRQSRYGQLSVVDWAGEKTLYINDSKVTQLSAPITAQETASLVMNQHPDPRRVLLIGGGLGGLAPELATYNGAEIEYVEQNRQALQIAQEYSPALGPDGPDNLDVIHTDGRRYLNEQTGEKYDLIIVTVGEPLTGGNHRYISREFLSLVREHLTVDGILVISGLPSAENYLGPELLQLNAGMYHELARQFPDVLALPGDKALFFAAMQEGVLTRDPRVLAQRMTEHGVVCEYFDPSMFWQYLTPFRLQSLNRQLSGAPHIRPQTDFHPAAYYYDFLLWNKVVQGRTGWWRQLSELPYWALLAGITGACLVLLVLALLMQKQRIGFNLEHGGITFYLGFSAMALNILLIFAFQIIFGYIYEWIGLALGLYMLGMSVSAYIASVLPGPKKMLTLVIFLLILSFILLWPVIVVVQKMFHPELFLLPVFLAGAASGAWFPVMCKRVMIIRKDRTATGLIYAMDVIGGALGAFCISGWIFPLYGLLPTLGILFAAGVVILILSWFDHSGMVRT